MLIKYLINSNFGNTLFWEKWALFLLTYMVVNSKPTRNTYYHTKDCKHKKYTVIITHSLNFLNLWGCTELSIRNNLCSKIGDWEIWKNELYFMKKKAPLWCTLITLLRIPYLGWIGSTKLVLPKWHKCSKCGTLNRVIRVRPILTLRSP